MLRVQLLVKRILAGESINEHTENYALAWMNSARRDLEALNVLAPPSSVRSLFVPPSELTDEELDEALRRMGINPSLIGQLPEDAAPHAAPDFDHH
jgi:hypothetical protein